MRLLNKIAGTTNSGIIGSGDLAVTQDSTPDMNVTIAIGDIVIPYLDYFYAGFCTATNQLPSVITAPASNSNIFSVVAYVDLTVVSSASNNNPGAMKFMSVAGTAGTTPVAPTSSAIQTAIGASNPYVILANITLASTDTSITNAKITDLRPIFKLFGLIQLPVIYGEYDNGQSGGSLTIDWSKGDRQKVVLTANAVTLTYTNAKAGQTLRLRMVQDATGGRVPTLPGGTKWPYGAASTFSTTANAIDEIVVDTDGGGNYFTQAGIGFA